MDLVYGHLGQPVYDTDSKTWHFARDAHSRRYMHLLCPLMNAEVTESNASFNGDLRQLERPFAGMDRTMLHDLLHISEAVELATSQHDPTVSDLISCGNAVDEMVPRSRPRLRYKPIVAVAGGAAGELVRLVALDKENLRWNEYKVVKLPTNTGRRCLVGWWRGSGGKIQQVTFAGNKFKASTILAVRHQGAISLLNPQIQMSPVCPSNALGRIQGLPPSQLDANHSLTITPADASGLPFADVAFDPCNYRRFVTVDQAGRWQIWIIKVGAMWTLSRQLSGSMNAIDDSEELGPILDGWVRALWAVDSRTLIIASRIAFTIFDIRAKRVDRNEPDLQLAKNSDWILDIKKCPASQCHLLILTSSRLLLVEVRGAGRTSTRPDAAVILVSWIHFRAHEDVSLCISVIENPLQTENVHVEDTTMVALYSRLTGLASVFGFRYSKLTCQASSMFDPCLLPLPSTASLPRDPGKARQDKHVSKPPLYLNLTTIQIAYGHGMELPEVFDQMEFYLLRILNHDWSISEHLYIASTVPNLILKHPDVRRRVRRKKTPAKVTDDFIVPDGVVDDLASEIAPDSKTAHRPYGPEEPKQQNSALVPNDASINQTPLRSLDMQWLVEQTNENSEDPVGLQFNNILEVIQEGIAEKLNTAQPGAETLLEMGVEDPSITDIDEATASLSHVLNSIRQSNPQGLETASEDHNPFLMSSLPQINDEWNSEQGVDLLQVYESLVRSEISPLPLNIPGRVRLERERDLRSVAAQLFLAAHTLSTRVKSIPEGGLNDDNVSTQDSNFLLPVREKGSAPSLSIGNASTDSRTLSSSRPSGPHPQTVSSQPLARKLRAGNIDGEFIEDPSSVYLRNLVSLTPQPNLPPKLSNILSHWRVGVDPGSYDWEFSQRLTIDIDDEVMADEEATLDRNAKRGKKRMRKSTATEDPVDGVFLDTRGVSSSQPALKRVSHVGSQEAPTVVASSQMVPESSQPGASQAISSQPLAGKFAGGKKVKKGRKKGF